jgi:hypothetical protein
MKKIYIASAYTKGDVAVNVKRQIMVADELIVFGYAPFVPLLSHFQHMFYSHDYATWATLMLEWVKVCDAVLRLPGESVGADAEVALAHSLDIPVFSSLGHLYVEMPA